MKKKNRTWIIVVLVLAIVVFGIIKWGISTFNGFVTLEEGVTGQWANVENVYQRRGDLIPNLVATVKGYAEHEQETLTQVVEARAKATSVTIDPTNITPESLAAFQQAQDGLSSALSRLLVTIERYPDLKANQNFLDLQGQLSEIEEQIQFSRRYYNGTARDMNILVQSFPSNLIARSFGFNEADYFEIELPTERETPKVEF